MLNGDIAYPTLILNLLPNGLVGLVIAALLAAVMGAMSSVFNSASTLVTLDFYKKIKPNACEARVGEFGRSRDGRDGSAGLLWVPFIHLISSQLYIYLQSVQAYISPPIAACFVFGILWPRLNAQGAITSLLTGFVLGPYGLFSRSWIAQEVDIGSRTLPFAGWWRSTFCTMPSSCS